jgi:CheY-like chemotaxis protein
LLSRDLRFGRGGSRGKLARTRASFTSTTAELLERIRAIDPDVILIDLASPSRDILEQMFKVNRSVARPVAMFVDRSDVAMTNAAIDAACRWRPQGPCEADSRHDDQPVQCLCQAQKGA